MTTRTVPELLAARAKATPNGRAFMVQDPDGQWRPITWAAYAGVVARLAAALHSRGADEGDRAAIFAPTSLEWEYAQLACLTIGSNVIGVDPNYPDDQLAAVLASVSPTILFVRDEASLARLQ